MPDAKSMRSRPQSPDIQIYRPQLTSVLSISHRICGIFSSVAAVGLVAWLGAAAFGPHAYGVAQSLVSSFVGQILLLGTTFAFFLHLCGGVRHLVWDAGYGLDLRSVYASGWAAVAASLALTAVTWTLILVAGR